MTKRSLALIFFLFIVYLPCLEAQQFSLSYGTNALSQREVDAFALIPGRLVSNSRASALVQAGWQQSLSDRFYLKGGFRYSNLGFQYQVRLPRNPVTRSEDINPNNFYFLESQSLAIPAGVGFKLFDDGTFALSLFGGIQVGYTWFSFNNLNEERSLEFVDLNNDDQLLETSWQAQTEKEGGIYLQGELGVQAQIYFKPFWGVYTEASFLQGLNQIHKGTYSADFSWDANGGTEVDAVNHQLFVRPSLWQVSFGIFVKLDGFKKGG